MALDNLLQPTHLILVLAIALIVLGPKRLPEVGRSLGRSIREFKGSLAENPEADSDERPRQDSNLGPAE
jgi:sec-independent protein translocase protein TatA